jgi:hypothetical protein
MKLLPKHTPCYYFKSIQKILTYTKLYTVTKTGSILVYKNTYAIGEVRIKINECKYPTY